MPRYCDVVIPRARLDELTYTWEPAELGELRPGDCVSVPLRGRPAAGVVFGLLARSPVQSTLAVKGLVRPGLLTREMLESARWVADYYCSRLGDVLGHLLPRRVERHQVRAAAAAPPAAREAAAGAEAGPLLAALTERRFGVWVSCRDRQRREWAAELIAAGLERGSVLLLLPEAKLGRWLPSLRERFGPALVEYHSTLGQRLLREAWLDIRWSERRLVVGVRAAALAPVPDLAGVVVIDEHDPAYKEERRPRFHGRDVAIARARQAGCPVLLLDRTPSIETWHNLEAGKYEWLEPPAEPEPRPGSFVVDMRLHRGELLSHRLVKELGRVRDAGRSAVIYINRRGLSRHVACGSCGLVLACAACGVPLVLGRGRVACGFCGTDRPAPDRCPQCTAAEFDFRAPGVEMFARALARLAGKARVREVVAESAGSPLAAGEFHVGTRALLGRQWPEDLALVAAVNADAGLALPDFRSRERVFQSLFEFCRRAARAGARAVIQTRRPDDGTMRDAVDGRVADFAAAELRLRRESRFPPAVRLALISLSGASEEALLRRARALQREMERGRRCEVLGPATEPGRRAAVRLLVKLPRGRKLSEVVAPGRLDRLGVEVRVDVDPLELL
ncbi:primosomal protein N' [candidate division WOR-3 bacterium]|nr:primosomal protein N' [candidate division WOR-3 bacterium]